MFRSEAKVIREKSLAGLGSALLLVALLAAYANHFRNSFHFDDAHTIETTRPSGNCGTFHCFSATRQRSVRSRAINRIARSFRRCSRLITVSADCNRSGFICRSSRFSSRSRCCSLLSFTALLERTATSSTNGWIALAAAAWYGLHPANADTVNYIIASSEVISTLGVIASFAVYFAFPRVRKSFLYVLPAAIAVLAKPTAAIFPVLFVVTGCCLKPTRHASHRDAATEDWRDCRAVCDLRSRVALRAAHDAAHLDRRRGERAQLLNHAALRGVALLENVLLAERALGRLRPQSFCNN